VGTWVPLLAIEAISRSGSCRPQGRLGLTRAAAAGPWAGGRFDIDVLGLWNSGTTVASLLHPDIGRSGTDRRFRPDHD
jgi:hypothetical protein